MFDVFSRCIFKISCKSRKILEKSLSNDERRSEYDYDTRCEVSIQRMEINFDLLEEYSEAIRFNLPVTTKLKNSSTVMITVDAAVSALSKLAIEQNVEKFLKPVYEKESFDIAVENRVDDSGYLWLQNGEPNTTLKTDEVFEILKRSQDRNLTKVIDKMFEI